MKKVYEQILEKCKKGKKQVAVLIDPDNFVSSKLIDIAEEAGVDYYFVGGSLVTQGSVEDCIKSIRKKSKKPVVLFPGSPAQLSDGADAVLFLSLISGRNAEHLIGKHVQAAPWLKRKKVECISCGYMLIESGKSTSVQYMSNTSPIPSDKNDIASATAIAGELLGLKLIYLEAGSGALNPVPKGMISQVKKNIGIPLLVGGGINTIEKAKAAFDGGADLIVIGNVLEKDSNFIKKVTQLKNTNS